MTERIPIVTRPESNEACVDRRGHPSGRPDRRSATSVLAIVMTLCALAGTPRSSRADIAIPDTLRFLPVPADTSRPDPRAAPESTGDGPEQWLRAPFGDNLLMEPQRWRSQHGEGYRNDLVLDYNRVDRLRLGINSQFQSPTPFKPRLGGRLEYSIGRERMQYGAQIEQPVRRDGRLAVGVSAVRRTDHSELQQHEDLENTLALLFGRQDYRDYFQRQGAGGYLLARVPSVSTVSLHVRRDEYRSLATDYGTRSWFHRDRDLRENPAIDEGVTRTWVLRSERVARRAQRTRPGLYHWMDFERAGHGLGGDFQYSRLLLDLRSVVRLTPASSFATRLVGGHLLDGTLPFQKHFTIGGVDGLRGHSFAALRGDHLAMVQGEYTVGLWRIGGGALQSGLHAIVFVDAGRAWFGPAGRWDVGKQNFEADGGFGLATSEDNLRVYFARNLQDADSDFVVSLRLQRPF